MAAYVTQDAYAQAYRQRSSFRGDVPVDAWLHRIAVNAALTGLWRAKVRWTEPQGAGTAAAGAGGGGGRPRCGTSSRDAPPTRPRRWISRARSRVWSHVSGPRS